MSHDKSRRWLIGRRPSARRPALAAGLTGLGLTGLGLVLVLGPGLGSGCLTGRAPDDGAIADAAAADAGGCPEPCVSGEGQCVQDFIRFCIRDPQGCNRWSAPQPCPPAKPFCSNARCEAVCDDECNEQGKRRCVTAGYQICGQHDSDKCLEWGVVLACSAAELCWPATGECLPDCNGKPCSCQGDETQPCANVGTCQGGIRHCVDGFFGPCEWQVGPKAEVCDGKDNDCNGVDDDGLVPEPCALQAGVCKDAVKSCGGPAGWQPCDSSVYQAQATSKDASYEETETTCDGDDNDCNGETDEPAACCQPDCSGKACGADDGCGFACKDGSCAANDQCIEGQCQCVPDCVHKDCGADDGCGTKCNGPCPDNATCQAGACVCDYLGCGQTCCAQGLACSASGDACCTPDCTDRACGLDPVCGASCGGCDPAEACVADGKCAAWTKPYQDPTATPLHDIWGLGTSAAAKLWAVGHAGVVVHHDGTSWASIAGAPQVGLRGVWAGGAPSTLVWVVGDAATIISYDGVGWTTVAAPGGVARDLFAVWGAGGTVRFAVGAVGTLLAHDELADPPWSVVDPGVSSALNDVWGSSETDVWVVGAGGTILRYDGAWASVVGPGTQDLFGIWGSGPSDVWAVGAAGTMIHFDGTGSWSLVGNIPTAEDLLAVWGNGPDDVWAVGAAGTMIHFDGTEWLQLTPPATDPINAIWTASAVDAWAVTGAGQVLQLAAP